MGSMIVAPGPDENCCCFPPDFVSYYRPDIRDQPITRANWFPRRAWDPDFYGLVVLAEFSSKDWMAEIRVDPPEPIDSSAVASEVSELLKHQRELRPGLLPEIRAQNTGFPEYFMKLLTMTRSSHPATYDLMKIAARVAEMLCAHYKAMFDRPRPSQVCPSLLPELTSLHPSYPNGHATISHLMAQCLAAAVQNEVYTSALVGLADRIGFNREVAGLHFPSDTAAGRDLARRAFALLETCDSYRRVLEDAQKEWSFLPQEGARAEAARRPRRRLEEKGSRKRRSR